MSLHLPDGTTLEEIPSSELPVPARVPGSPDDVALRRLKDAASRKGLPVRVQYFPRYWSVPEQRLLDGDWYQVHAWGPWTPSANDYVPRHSGWGHTLADATEACRRSVDRR